MLKRFPIIMIIIFSISINLFVHILANSSDPSQFLQSAIVLENAGGYQMVRTPEDQIEYWANVSGVYTKVACFQAADMINIRVNVKANFNPDNNFTTEYSYEVISDSSSRDKVSAFGFILQHSEWDYDFQSTLESSDWSWNNIYGDLWSWSCVPPCGIEPGTSQQFKFTTPSLPGLAECFALSEKRVELDWQSFAEAELLTLPPNWLRGVKGPIIAPVPVEWDNVKIADRLINYLPICEQYGWISANTNLYLGYALGIIRDNADTDRAYARKTIDECYLYVSNINADYEMNNTAKVLFLTNLDVMKLNQSH